jgi:Ca-activated chloride channel family protein
MDEPADPDSSDESARALSDAIDKALAEQGESQSPVAGEALDPAAQAEAERRQSVEQWLRRVPDDPGALLRRKFVLEHRRRQREGIQ